MKIAEKSPKAKSAVSGRASVCNCNLTPQENRVEARINLDISKGFLENNHLTTKYEVNVVDHLAYIGVNIIHKQLLKPPSRPSC